MKRKVQTITTPGEDVDVLVTEFGIAINPKRKDLLEKLENSQLPIMDIKSLLDIAHKITRVSQKKLKKNKNCWSCSLS